MARNKKAAKPQRTQAPIKGQWDTRVLSQPVLERKRDEPRQGVAAPPRPQWEGWD